VLSHRGGGGGGASQFAVGDGGGGETVRLRYRDYTDVLSHMFGEPYLVNLRSSLPGACMQLELHDELHMSY
jgi:hypothetical protein